MCNAPAFPPAAATVRCPKCKGDGCIGEDYDEAAPGIRWCSRCLGTGRVPARHGAAKLDAIVKPVKEA